MIISYLSFSNRCGLKSKNKTAQKNELLCKIIAYNITVLIAEMHQLGINPDFKAKNSFLNNLRLLLEKQNS